ncbi:Regulator of G-protein signaling 20 [Mactra antiquata]
MVTRSATLRQLIATCWIYQMNTVMNRQTGSSNEVIRMRNSRPGSSHTQNDTPPSSPAQTDERASRACCFCWCCCCTCSCLTVKNGTNKPDRSGTRNSEPVNEEPLTIEEIRSWAESFDKLMRKATGRKVFREFLRSEYSEENMLFWLACEELKQEQSSEGVEEKARLIYEDYISILSPKEVSLDSRVREKIDRNMVEPTPHTFDEAQLQIYTLMHRDSYTRFINSQIYKKLIQQYS